VSEWTTQPHAVTANRKAAAPSNQPVGNIKCRFKRPGQFWSLVGDEGLMCLETFWRNDRWHLLFPHILHGDPRRN
jgi:hypothetical protein